MDLIWPINSRGDTVAILSMGSKKSYMFPLSVSLTPAQPQARASLLDDETYVDQSPPLPQPTTNQSPKAELPTDQHLTVDAQCSH